MSFFDLLKQSQGFGKGFGQMNGAEGAVLGVPTYSEALKRLQGLELQAGPPSEAETDMLKRIVQQGPSAKEIAIEKLSAPNRYPMSEAEQMLLLKQARGLL